MTEADRVVWKTWQGMDELARLDAWWSTVRDRVEAGEEIPIGRNAVCGPEMLRDAYERRRAELAREP